MTNFEELHPLSVISREGQVDEMLLVTNVSVDRLSAGTIGKNDKGREFVTPPGTYLESHLGEVTVHGSWDAARAARALAIVWFNPEDYPDSYNERYNKTLSSFKPDDS